MELSEEQIEAIRTKAEEGDRDAQYELGWRHAIGMGLELDDDEALEWLIKAAEQGHPLAQNNLGGLEWFHLLGLNGAEVHQTGNVPEYFH